LFDIANILWQVARNIFWKNSGTQMQVSVRDNNVDQALRALKKKLQREGVFREMRLKEHFEKPSVQKAREKKESISRQRKLERKKAEREG
jgi:small subunit ribosomal protein S21|tara:strand:- start:614 stop:883 length:270 start_codon:yes stop_codon:yes gene_type:complete